MGFSWSVSAFHCSATESNNKTPVDICTMLSLFPDDTKYPSVMKHAMNAIQQNVYFMNPDQVPVGSGINHCVHLQRLELATKMLRDWLRDIGGQLLYQKKILHHLLHHTAFTFSWESKCVLCKWWNYRTIWCLEGSKNSSKSYVSVLVNNSSLSSLFWHPSNHYIEETFIWAMFCCSGPHLLFTLVNPFIFTTWCSCSCHTLIWLKSLRMVILLFAKQKVCTLEFQLIQCNYNYITCKDMHTVFTIVCAMPCSW